MQRHFIDLSRMHLRMGRDSPHLVSGKIPRWDEVVACVGLTALSGVTQ